MLIPIISSNNKIQVWSDLIRSDPQTRQNLIHKQTLQQTEDNTTLIVVCIVVGSIVIGGVIIGVVIYFKLKRGVNKTTENTKKLSGAMINYYH